jgi:arylsulfatase A
MRSYVRVAALLAAVAAGAGAAEKPNIVFVLCDDLGYGDVQCLNPGRGRIPTPNLDHLAKEGMVFTDAHSGSSVCTPTRYGILTGRYAWRTRLQHGVMQDNQPPLIAAGRLTVAGLLRQQGYRTACIGKWHLGYLYEGATKAAPGVRFPDGPISRGFDYFFGYHHAGAIHALAENDRVIETIAPVEMLPRLTRRAVAYVEERAKAGQSFFLYLPLNSPHAPIMPTAEWRGKSGLNDYGDYVMQTDAAVGEVLSAIGRSGLASNTLVIFTSDNGCSPAAGVEKLEKMGHFPSARFRGYKSDIWDGGHRIPFMARWPGRVKPGTSSDQLVCLGDLMATCADLLKVELPPDAGEDSFSFMPALLGQGAGARDAVVHHSIKGNFAIRQGPWKLILTTGSGGWGKGKVKDAPGQLYDMRQDVGERANLYTSHPEAVSRLTELLKKYVADGRSTPGPGQTNDAEVVIRKKDGKPAAGEK